MKHARAGFTLIELIVVVLIIGLLAAIVVPKFTAQLEPTRATVTRANLRAIEDALERYHLDHGRYPASLEDLPKTYLKRVPNDAWDRRPLYRLREGGDPPYDLVSLGADGLEGGSGADEDLHLE